MANLITEELYNLLTEKQNLIQDSITAAHDYPSLKAQIIQQELHDEIEALLKLLGEGSETFHQEFVDRCKQRAEQNAHTCLSLFAMPDGECNQLYWQIAERLFEPKTMGDMLKLLLPTSSMLLTYEATLDASEKSLRKGFKNPVFHFEKRSLASLEQKPSRAALNQFAVSDDLLFDVADLVQWEFTTHTKFFNCFTQQYPELAEALYQHNEAFKKLRQNLLAVSKGQSPREVIKEFIQQFLLGGETLTGETYASLDAQKAVTDFFVYLESLPSPLKEALLALETPSGISLDYVCEHLRDENCIEQAAIYLQEIVNNNDNAPPLDTRPDLSPEQLQRIHQSYGKSHALSSVSDSPTALPLNYLKKNLEELVIKDMHVLLDLLLAFPPSYYPLLFKYAQISYDASSLGEMIASGIFLGEQLTAIHQAIIDNMEKFGGFSVCLQFALHHQNDELVKHLFSLLAQKEQPAVFLIEQLGGFSESLRIAIAHKNYDLLKLILTSLPLEERLAALLQAKIADGTPMLAFATVRMPSQFHWILELLPEEHRLTAITATEGKPTVLYLTAEDPEVIGTTLSLLPEKDRFTAIRAETKGKSGLSRGVFHAEVFKAMLTLLPPADRLNTVTERIFSDLNALEVTLSREVFKEILNLLPDIVAPSDTANSTEQSEQIAMLYEHIQQLKNHGLELYDKVDDRETEGKEAICLAVSLAAFANHFINAQTNAAQQTAQRKFLQELQQSAYTPEQTLLKPILANIAITAFAYAPCLSEELGTLVKNGLFNNEQLAHLNQTIVTNIAQAGGISASLRFTLTYKNYELLKLILSSLPPEKRLEALRAVTTKTDPSVLDFANTQVEGDLNFILEMLHETTLEERRPFLYFIRNYPEALCSILALLPASDRLDAVTEKIAFRRNSLQLTTSKKQFDQLLKSLPTVISPTKGTYSAKKNEQIEMLYDNIEQLKSYGLELYNQVNGAKAETEGKKAISLAICLSYFAERFIYAQNGQEQLLAQRAFQEELQQGIRDMQHRALWKPILANIVIAGMGLGMLAMAATGLGTLVLAGSLYLTGSTFFMQTERHKKLNKIANTFTALSAEEALSTNSTTTEIVSHLNTELSPSA